MRNSYLFAAALLASVCFVMPAAAHGPTPRKVEISATIDAPPEKVWEVAKEYGSIAEWHPGVESAEASGGNASGGKRKLVLKSGATLPESLDEYLDDQMSYAYRLETPDLEHFPVSFYSASFQVKPGKDGGSQVEWIGRFYRADTGNFPSEAQNDEAATKAMTEFFEAGLAGLKEKAEAK